MKLSSSAFSHNGHIPSQYTCDGEGINPPLRIEFVPVMAKTLALIMDDPDIPDVVKKNFHIEKWDHWIVFDIPTNVSEIKEGQNPPGKMGRNTHGSHAYGGPCPPDKEHRYFFKLYALDTKLELHAGATRAEVEKAMEGHILAKAELIGLYERKKQ